MTTTISASPQTLTDSAPQLIHDGPLCAYLGAFCRTALPDPTCLQPSLAKRRSRADRHLLSELGRTMNISKRRSSHKAMAKRMFFLLSQHHYMQKSASPSYEIVLQLDQKSSPQYRLPSFLDGFSDSVQDTGHLDSMHSQTALKGVSRRQEKAELRLPSTCTIPRREWY